MRRLAGAGRAPAPSGGTGGRAALARSALCAAAGLLLVVAGLLGVSAAAQAQTTFVSNIGQTLESSEQIVGTGSFGAKFTQAQPFGTGDNADGYTLSEVVVKVGQETSSDDVPRVSIYSNSSGNPGTSLYTLNNPVSFASGDMIFTAPANATLTKETDYFVVFEETVGNWRLRITDSNGVDTAESGWGIGDTHAWRNSDSGAWSSHDSSLLITIKGTVNGGTTLSTDATLTDLALEDFNGDAITLNEIFASNLLTYTASVAYSDNEIQVTPTLSDANATIEYLDGEGATLTDADTGTNGFQVDLDPGDNVIGVKVTAEDGTTTQTYTVTVNRRTIHHWIKTDQLDRDLAAGARGHAPRPPVAHKLDPYKVIIEARLKAFPKQSAKRLFDEVGADGCPNSVHIVPPDGRHRRI